MTYLLIFITSLITTIFLTPFLISFLKKTKIVDNPDGNQTDPKAIPSMGGLIIYIIVLVMLNSFVEDFDTIKLILVSATILVFLGIVNDVIGINSFVKFIVQNISAIILIIYLQNYYSDVYIFGFSIESPLNYLVLLVFIVATLNSISFMDGLDGLASRYSLLIFAIILALAIDKDDYFLILLSVSLLGSTLGFLRFNAFPASIFLGNTGSFVLGFFLILISCLTSINYQEGKLDLTFPLILLAVPLIDTIKVFFYRIFKKRDPFSSDLDHQYHILKKSFVSHEATMFIIELFSILFILISIFYLKGFRFEATLIFFILGILFISLHPIFERISVPDKINSFLVYFHQLPIKNLFLLMKFLMVFSAILILIIYLISLSHKTSLSNEELIFLLVTVSGLLGLSIFQSKSSQKIPQINIFLNFTIFFIISKLSLPTLFNEEISAISISQFYEIAFYFLTAAISIILVLRWKALMTRKLFFTGLDLTLIIFMLLSFIVNNMLQFDLNYFLSISLLEAFIFYVWFKLVVDIRGVLELKLTIISFLMPISLIIILIISGNF